MDYSRLFHPITFQDILPNVILGHFKLSYLRLYLKITHCMKP
jgi:hypothetical protein